MKKIIIVLAMLLTAAICFAQTIGSAPTVSGVQMIQEGGIVKVTYNLSYEDETPPYSHITLLISNDGGATFKISPKPEFLEGHIGMGVPHGDNREIIWRIRAQYDVYGEQGLIGENFRARVIAKRDDNYNPDTYDPEDPASSVPAGMVYVQGTEGVTFTPGGLGFFTPATSYHVSLSSFYISQFEVTQEEYTAVMGVNPSWFAAEGIPNRPNLPVERVSWFDAIEYCNRRSMMEGLTPCYSYTVGETEYGTTPDDWPAGWNTNSVNHTNVSCNWNADGYRLPTEMEREYAARGGVPAATANTFNHDWAGTNVAGTGEGQLGDYAWYSANNTPSGTKAVGTKLPNELGLYDMSGNVWNMVWDRLDGDLPTGTVTDPKGKDSGTNRVGRGGCWQYIANFCTVSIRVSGIATLISNDIGFRVARNTPPPPPVPEGMVLVQGTAGVTFNPGGLGYFTPAADYHVSLSSFYISQFEVTQEEYTAVMGVNPSWFAVEGIPNRPNLPVERVSWFDAIEYCNRRSIMEGLTPCYSYTVGETEYGTNPDNWPAGWNTDNDNHTNVSCNWNADGYRMPTEMEWEYAARGGVSAANADTFNHLYAGTNVAGQLGDYAWYSANNDPYGSKAVGTKLPNELGLYDMNGNVWNMVWDRLDGDLPTGTVTDPKGKDSGTNRVGRGGSWQYPANLCTVSFRVSGIATLISSDIGFRVARNVP